MNSPQSPSDVIRKALQLNGDSADLQRFYQAWAGNYDQDVAAEAYIAPQILVDLLPAAGACRLDPDLQFLDAGCGTGLVGQLLHDRGFRNIDGFDLSCPMVEKAAQLGVYRHLHGDIDMNHPLQTYTPQSYDVILCCGVFTHGHVPPHSLVHLIRLAKLGGLLLISTRTTYCQESDYLQVSAEFVAQGLLTLLHQVNNAPYTRDSRAHYWVYRVEKSVA
jgi:predicted TPR repeat methyltransferase